MDIELKIVLVRHALECETVEEELKLRAAQWALSWGLESG